MASSVNPYKACAQAFQAAQDTIVHLEAEKSYELAKVRLKASSQGAINTDFFVANFIQGPQAQQKAIQKIGKWQEAKNEDFDPVNFGEVLSKFGRAFLATLKIQNITDARFLKKIFKLETFKLFETGATVEQVQSQLEGLNSQTIAKVASWMETYQELKASNALEDKICELKRAIRNYD